MGKLVASFWFRAAVSLIVLAGLLAGLDLRAVGDALASASVGFLVAAVLADAAARALMIGRWSILLRAGGAPVSLGSTARIFLIASFMGTALPSVGADVVRAYALSRRNVGGRAAAASVVIDRLLGVSALLMLGIVGLALGTPEADVPYARLLAGLCFAVAVLLLGALWADRIAAAVAPWFASPVSLSRWTLATAGEIARYRKGGAICAVFGLSLVVQWLRITEVFLLGAGLGLDVGFGYYLVFMPIGWVFLMLPISIAGLGLPQGVIIWLLRPAGVPDATSFALSTLLVALGLFGTLPGLYLYLRAR